MPLTHTPAGWQPIDEALNSFRDQCGSFGHELDSLLEDLDRLALDVELRADEIHRRGQTVDDRECELTATTDGTEQILDWLSRQDERLATLSDEFAQFKSQLAHASPPQPTVDDEAMQKGFEAARLENESLREQLNQSLAELSSVAGALSELSDLPQQLATLKAELKPDHTTDENPLHESARLIQEQLAEMLAERERLQDAVASADKRSVELNQLVEEQRRQLTEQSTALGEQMALLRAVIQEQANVFAVTAAATQPSGTETLKSQSGKAPTAAAGSPVVNSVMAQFAKLQKDAAGRRIPKQ